MNLTESSSPTQAHFLHHAQETPEHRHSQGHLVYPASGLLSLSTAEGTWAAPNNTAIWVPSGTAHRHRAWGATDMRILFIPHAEAPLLPEAAAAFAVSALVREAILSLTDVPSEASTATPPEAQDRLRRVIIDQLQPRPISSLRYRELKLPELRDKRLRKAEQLVVDNLEQQLSLAEIGRQVGASERTLSRLFQSETGMGYRQWRTQVRIFFALVFLNDGQSITTTALACGWANPSAFISSFTDFFAITPGAYQQNLFEHKES